jgi:Uma2 family endonuclease
MVYFAPVPVRLGRQEYREPDVFYISTARVLEAAGNYPNGADLVIKVVCGSPADRDRDLVRKRRDYALAGIPEYWIVDPQEQVIFVLQLDRNEYVEHGRFTAGDTATSALLSGFVLPVADVWASAKYLAIRRDPPPA